MRTLGKSPAALWELGFPMQGGTLRQSFSQAGTSRLLVNGLERTSTLEGNQVGKPEANHVAFYCPPLPGTQTIWRVFLQLPSCILFLAKGMPRLRACHPHSVTKTKRTLAVEDLGRGSHSQRGFFHRCWSPSASLSPDTGLSLVSLAELFCEVQIFFTVQMKKLRCREVDHIIQL